MNSIIEESNNTPTSFSAMKKFDGQPIINALSEMQNTILRLQPVPASFKQIYTVDPIFNLMYPRTKVEMNMLALSEDIYDFSNKIKTDFNLYKYYRKYLNQCKIKYQQLRKTIDASEKQLLDNPRHLTWDEMWQQIEDSSSNKTSNPSYDKIVDRFISTDLKGYQQDARFANLIDDALHTFYAAHCDYFLTLDRRCYDKAKKVFHDLKISTEVMTPDDFIILNGKD